MNNVSKIAAVAVVSLSAAGLWTGAGVRAQTGAKSGEWRYYGGDAGSTKYSPLDQINKQNIKDLQVVWR